MEQETPVRQTSTDRRITLAADLQLVQGVLMEGLPFLGLGMFLVLGLEEDVLTQRFSFIVPFFSEHMLLMMAMSGIFAALRIIGAVGLRRNRMWGYALSVINCGVTLVLMTFMLPAGIADGILSGAALVLLLIARYGTTPIR
ncbi:MAG TPA: DUF2127 domain-containing protein [Candidatus Brevibacterium intestinigallinarum]|nr:DUF2127 domain-containing protein [Candidatus Brevibacterium intestinigallinarum]